MMPVQLQNIHEVLMIEYSRSAYDSAFVFPRDVLFEVVAFVVSETPHNSLSLVARVQDRR